MNKSEQRKVTYIRPDIKLCQLLGINIYDKVFKVKEDGTVDQAMGDLQTCNSDIDEARIILKKYQFFNFGPGDLLFLRECKYK